MLNFPCLQLTHVTGEWGKMLSRYEDSRFVTDKIFGFFALNYITRHRNASKGHWFVNKFHTHGPRTLEDLKKQIQDGDLSYVNSLNYQNRTIKGSSPFWFKKKMELYTWINYHIEQGNGAPMFFITLSCAEHMWEDIIRLIRERVVAAGEDESECHGSSSRLSQYLNDYSIVVQEYFQERVKSWLKTVGHTVFGIKHYWIRYEFAPGRGQIHAHLLAISNDQSIYTACHKDLTNKSHGNQMRATRLSEWAAAKFGLTASVNPGFDDIDVSHRNTPMHKRHGDIAKEDQTDDIQQLLAHVQNHQCNGFCMRPDKKRQ